MPTSPAILAASGNPVAALPVTALLMSNGSAREVAGCFGVTCVSRGHCALYHAIETAARVIDTCETLDHRRPLFELLPTAARPVPADDGEGSNCD